jgi:multiple sugar transport system ATP-binding protein
LKTTSSVILLKKERYKKTKGANGMVQIVLKNINKKYAHSEEYAVKDLNLEIKDKEFLVFVGPSGCGKSTTLRMIAGLEEISEGELYIGENLVNHVAPKDRDLSMVFQNYALYPHLKVYDNIAFGMKIRKFKKKEIKKRVNEAAEILGLKDLLNRKPGELSGGQRQRVALGRAIVRHPKAFLLDEPLSNLDAKLRVAMRAEIVRLHRELETNFIYVTHDQTEAMTMGDRIAVLNNGHLEQIDTPVHLYQYSKSKFVAEFIGSPPMNVFPSELVEKEGKYCIRINNQLVKLGNEVVERMKEHTSLGEVFAGIRPEALEVVEKTDEAIQVKVENVERMGSDTYIFFYIDEQKK